MAVQDVYKSAVDNYANRIAQVKKNRQEDEAAVTNRYNTSVSQLGKSRDKAMREAYITREQSKRDVPTMLAQQGITGGATETTLSNLYRNYMNARNAANESFDTNKVTLDNEYQSNMLKLRDSYDDTIANLEDKKNAADLEYQQYLANMAAQAAASSGGYGGYGGSSSSSNSATAPTRNTTVNGSGYRNGIYNGSINDNANNTSTLVSKMMIRNPNSSQYGKMQYKYRNSDGSYRYEVR